MKIIIIFIIITFALVGTVFCELEGSEVTEELEMEVFKLKHRDAASLYPVVEHLKSKEGKVTIDLHTDSLIVVDYPKNLKQMAELIERLDVPQKQVEVKVVVAEVTGAFLGKIGMISGQAVIPPDKFDEITYLIDKSEDSSIRSQMTVKTLSGQPATLQVAQEEILWGTTIAPESGVTTVSPVTTRSAGKFLEVLPKVNNDGSITITLRPSVSEFQPDRSVYERSILTQVIVNDGDTIAIGGLETAKRRTEQSGIPFTGTSMPVRSSKEDKRIVMFLTATVLD